MSKVSPGNAEEFVPGIYEEVLTDRVLNFTSDIDSRLVLTSEIEPADGPEVLSRHVSMIFKKALAGLTSAEQLDLTNRLLGQLDAPNESLPGVAPEILRELLDTVDAVETVRPASGFNSPVLLTNAREEPNLGSELRAELVTADEVDMLSAFVKWAGIRVIEKQLIELQHRGARLRVLTTTYMGATEKRAVDELVTRFGAEVRVNYEVNSTRLHAKAWMFKRKSGLHTAYVGSSNLSRPALVEGIEWNVRISESDTPTLMRKFDTTFQSYWNDPSFEEYLPERDGDRLKAALAANSKYEANDAAMDVDIFEVHPYPHQQQILDDLQAEREVHDRHKNLVIAATGTGKTVVAALDFARLCAPGDEYPTLLFVAHRQEILKQSLATYRRVLMDATFGELFVDGQKPTRWTHVFASVQSLASAGVLESIALDQFDIIVIDEFHHSEAKTYRRLLDHFEPKELLGLTATPERADGVDVREAFFDGRAASEIRLWHALDADLLVPFHYFGIDDGVDLHDVAWGGPQGYNQDALAKVYLGDAGRQRAERIIEAVRDKVTDVSKMRALGFCASVTHAEFMTDFFNDSGIPSLCVTGSTPSQLRRESIERLRNGEVNCIFAVDVFNEGLDIPQVDTVLMLRPTQSPTIFLQQLGRGLRRDKDKSVLTVLDFIGFHRKEFRFDKILRAVTGATRSKLIQDIQHDFPFLPAGCQILLEEIVKERVLENVRSQLRFPKKDLINDVRSYLPQFPDITLIDYLTLSGRELGDVYKVATWTEVRVALDLAPAPTSQNSEILRGSMKMLLHVDDVERAVIYRRLAQDHSLTVGTMTSTEVAFAEMFTTLLWKHEVDTVDEVLKFIRSDPEVVSEISQIMSIVAEISRRLPKQIESALPDCPLRSHASYRREEILKALKWKSAVRAHREGVAWCPDSKVDALLITLHKTEEAFSPNVMYHDYALSQTMFHWQTQNSTSSASVTGKRYINHVSEGSHVVLFSRDSKETPDGITAAYVCLGNAEFVSFVDERPMSITWRLQREMPMDVYQSASAVKR